MRAPTRGLLALAAAAALALGPAAAASADGMDGKPWQPDIAEIRQATVPFQQFDEEALAEAGYTLKLPDGDGVTFCIDKPGVGGMGVHYVNPGALAPGFDPAVPEVLVYEPGKNGRMKLVAVEFVVFEGDLAPGEEPEFLGQTLMRHPGAGEAQPQNRYGLPAFYALHVWLFAHNPAGMFADYNPKVSCP